MLINEKVMESIITDDISYCGNDIILIKNDNYFSLKSIYNNLITKDNSHVLFCRYSSDNYVYEPYYPMLKFLKNDLLNEYNLINIINDINIYPSHRSLFISYIANDICERNNEEILPFDFEYEKGKVYNEILNIFNGIAKKENVYILLENLNYMNISTLEWLSWVVKNNKKHYFKLIITVGSYDYKFVELQDYFDNLIEMIESKYSLIEADTGTDMIVEEYMPVLDRTTEIQKAENLYQLFALEDARKCFSSEYEKIKSSKNEMEANNKLDYIIMRIGNIYLLQKKYHEAYVYYDILLKGAIERKDLKLRALSWQKLSMLNILTFKYEVAERFAKSSYKIGDMLNNDFIRFKAYELLFWVNEKGKYRTTVENLDYEDEFIALAKKYNQKNTLSYYLTHNFNVISYVGERDRREDYYNEGHRIARELKNENCIISADLKSALVYAVNGKYDVSIKFYMKVVDLLKIMNDNFRLAQTYNGIGYYYLTRSCYEQSNEYYDKSLQYLKNDWNFDEICMTLVNKSINAILAGDYYTAEKQLDIFMKVVKILKLNRLRLTTISRIFGIRAITQVYLGNIYKSYSYLSKMDTVKSPQMYYEDDDEYFLNNFVQALITKKKGQLEDSKMFFKKAMSHIRKIKGSLKCFMPLFLIEYRDLMKLCGNKKGEECLEKCSELLYKKNNLLYYMEDDQHLKKLSFSNSLPEIDWVVEAAKQEATINQLNDKVDEINFIKNFQEILTSSDNKGRITSSSMIMLESKFSIDYSMLVFFDNDEVIYSTNNIKIPDEKLADLYKIVEKDYESYAGLNNKSLVDFISTTVSIEVQSMIYIPVVKNEKLKAVFAAVTKKDTDKVNNKVILNKSNLRILTITVNQIVETVQKIEWQNKLVENANTDVLTGIYNRQYFYNVCEKILLRCRKKGLKLALFYLDLDNFKYYNDSFGHNIGDYVLKSFTSIIKSVNFGDVCPVRFGGDEFILIVEDCDENKAKSICSEIYRKLDDEDMFKENISDKLKRNIEIPSEKTLSCSIGIRLIYPDESTDVNRIVNMADTALYSAKKSGKGRCIFYKDQMLTFC